jgi:hypothetical protein
MVAELARVRFFVATLKSGDSSYPKIKLQQSTSPDCSRGNKLIIWIIQSENNA